MTDSTEQSRPLQSQQPPASENHVSESGKYSSTNLNSNEKQQRCWRPGKSEFYDSFDEPYVWAAVLSLETILHFSYFYLNSSCPAMKSSTLGSRVTTFYYFWISFPRRLRYQGIKCVIQLYLEGWLGMHRLLRIDIKICPFTIYCWTIKPGV